MSIAPPVRVIALLGFMAMASAGCTSTPPNDPPPVLQTPPIVIATDAPIAPPSATLVLDATPSTLLPTLAATASANVTALPATALPAATLNAAPEPTSAAATSAPAPPAAGDEQERQMIDAINQQRSTNSCPPLTRSPALTTAARRHSQDMATHDFLGHTGSDGSTRASRAQEAGYIIKAGERVRENIAVFAQPADVMSTWMGDAITRSQILDCSYNEIGIGYAKINKSQSSTYWTALFGVRP